MEDSMQKRLPVQTDNHIPVVSEVPVTLLQQHPVPRVFAVPIDGIVSMKKVS
jgi:hypothetical protein